MVDISDKMITHRTAVAQAILQVDEKIIAQFETNDIQTKKGAVFQTAILAGIMGAKKTSDLIPLCHPLSLDKCGIEIHINESKEIVIKSTAKIQAKTGVEMEAITGASVAALTIYDMCKGFSQNIVIKEIKLLHKTGGKSDYKVAPLHGIVFAGGKSERMGEDKSQLKYHDKSQIDYLCDLLDNFQIDSQVSCRPNQTFEQNYDSLKDRFLDMGPMGALLTVFQQDPNKAIITLPCDTPFLDKELIDELLANRNPNKLATCFHNPETSFPEPLICIWEPSAYPVMLQYLAMGYSCPRKVLINSPIHCIQTNQTNKLFNANTPKERDWAMAQLKGK
ncbi:UNVERIFIED_CONTAM: hypothetical protein GTU68_008824 [Idotea baltica]|nr:hypothetical protein [Idotea baltica]